METTGIFHEKSSIASPRNGQGDRCGQTLGLRGCHSILKFIFEMNLNLRCPEARSLFGEQRRRGEKASAWGWRGGTPTAGELAVRGGKGPRLDTPSSSRSSASTREVDGATHEPQPPNRPTPVVHLGARQSVGRRASAPGSAGAAHREAGEGPAAASQRVHMWRGRGAGWGEPRGRVYIQRSSRMVSASGL